MKGQSRLGQLLACVGDPWEDGPGWGQGISYLGRSLFSPADRGLSGACCQGCARDVTVYPFLPEPWESHPASPSLVPWTLIHSTNIFPVPTLRSALGIQARTREHKEKGLRGDRGS